MQSPKSTDSINLLNDVMSGITDASAGASASSSSGSLASKRTMTKEERQREMMRKLKLKQNAQANDKANAEAELVAEALEVDIMDAGPYGNVGHENKQKITAHIRRARAQLAAGTEQKSRVRASALETATLAEASQHPSSTNFRSPEEIGPFSYKTLTGMACDLPKGVNPRRREMYLNETEFCGIFGVNSRAEFMQLPKLKRDKLKQQKRLFN